MLLAVLMVPAVPLVGCGDGGGEGGYVPPDAPGRYQAGTFAATAPGPQDLMLPVQLWYPTTAGPEEAHAYDPLDLTEGSVVPGGPGACRQRRPVVVFSHGNGGVGYQTFSLAEHLARHGYVVAAPDHVENTVFDSSGVPYAYLFMRRPLDVTRTFDWLVEEADRPGSPVEGCVDPEAGYAVMGHSFGGWTTLAVAGAALNMETLHAICESGDSTGCEPVDQWVADHPGEGTLDRSDPRVWAAAPLAPAWHELLDPGLADISVPILVAGADRDMLTPWEQAVRPAYDRLEANPRYLARLEDAGHYSFTDFCDVLLMLGQEGDGCGEGYRPAEEVLATLRVLITAFLDSARGQAEAQAWLPPESGVDLFESP